MAMISRALFTSVIGLCLMASSVTSTASSPAVKPTVCRAVWLANDPKTQSGSNVSAIMRSRSMRSISRDNQSN